MAVEQMALQTAIRPAVDRAELSDRSIALAYAVAKRGIDILGAVFGLLMLLPLFALVGLAILLDSGWPVFYRGERVGRHGRSFAVTDRVHWMRRRLVVKPGMTGLWQVSGRSRLSLLDMYRLDVNYVAGASLQLDLSILLRTVPVVMGRDGAA